MRCRDDRKTTTLGPWNLGQDPHYPVSPTKMLCQLLSNQKSLNERDSLKNNNRSIFCSDKYGDETGNEDTSTYPILLELTP